MIPARGRQTVNEPATGMWESLYSTKIAQRLHNKDCIAKDAQQRLQNNDFTTEHVSKQGPDQSPDQGPDQGSDQIPGQVPDQGPHQSPHQGPHQGPHEAPHQGSDQGPDEP